VGNPLKQFEVVPIIKLPFFFGASIDFTNASLFMLLASCCAALLLFIGTYRREIVPGKMQCLVEMFYNFVSNVFRGNTQIKDKFYFDFVFTIFLFVLFGNIIGLLPFSFTITSHIIVTFTLALIVFLVAIFAGFAKQKMGFFRIFLPSGTPWWLMPLMILIELFAFLARPITLSIRLAANMMAGHIMLKVIAGLAINFSLVFVLAPLLSLVVLIGFEFFVSVLQAYIFMVLTCVYINDALRVH
jgi:F-type H+-transporting ATPase subunit a